MAFGTMTSRILGQLRESLLAAYFDKRVTDAWAAAFRMPNLFRRLLGEGSLSVSFIPVFVDAHLDSKVRAQNVVNAVYSYLLVILGCLTAFGIFHPEPLLQLILDSSYRADIEKFQMTLRLTKIMFGFVFFISSYAFMMGILNALGQFALPAIAPTLWNLCMILTTIMPKTWFTHLGDQLGWGVLIGGALQALLLLPALIRAGYLPHLSFDYKNRDFLKVIKNMAPGLMGMGLLQFTTIVNLRFASSLTEGTISYINYVDRLIELPLSLVSVSLGSALLPVLSGYLSQKRYQNFSDTIQKYMQLNLLMTMVAAAGLFSLAHPIVQLLFGRGHFQASDVTTTSEILKTYCWIMVFSSGVRVLTPAYYAVKNTWFPAAVSAICLVVHIIIAPILMKEFLVRGLMLSTILSAFLNFSLLLIFMTKLVIAFDYKQFFKSVVLFAMMSVMVGASSQIFFIWKNFFAVNFFGLLLNLILSIAVAVVVFLLAGKLLRINLVTDIMLTVQRKFLPRK